MIGVVLAAGRGTRLGELGERAPKALLDVGGRSLLERSLSALGDTGIDRTIIVVGHRGDDIVSRIGSEHDGMAVGYIRNPEYATTGSAVSLALVESVAVDEPILVVESDLVYDPVFVSVAHETDQDVLLVADASGSGDEVFVHVDGDGNLVALGKGLWRVTGAERVGELAGITRIGPDLFRAYVAAVRQRRVSGSHDFHYEEVLADLARQGAPIRVAACEGRAWVEVDTPQDLERARRHAIPRIDHG